jgi:protein-S-isoprenylcysteine O-methyltransferase Ste14
MKALELKIPPLAQVLIIGGLMGLVASISREFLLPLAIRWWGALLFVVPGVVLNLAAAWHFRRRGTTLNPLNPDAASALVTSGVYRISRNPIYAGFLLCLCGWACYLANRYALLGPILFVLYMNYFQIRPEERALEKLFGPEYDAYRRLVRRWL